MVMGRTGWAVRYIEGSGTDGRGLGKQGLRARIPALTTDHTALSSG